MRIILIIITSFLLSCSSNAQEEEQNFKTTWTPEDIQFFNQLVSQNTLLDWAKCFKGISYASGTLEEGNDSTALVNFHALDCTTYVENVLALATLDSLSKNNFAKQLTKFRYRNAVAKGYASRLHYFSEWIFDNEHKGFVKDITKELGGVRVEKEINFMTTHRKLYPQLKDDGLYKEMQKIEANLSKKTRYIIPKSTVKKYEEQIKDGDIICLATNIKGLDFVHVGFAIHKDGQLHLLHASSKAKKVIVSEQSFVEYIKNWKAVSGIAVLRINNEKHN